MKILPISIFLILYSAFRLFRFFVQSMFFAILAIFLQFQSFLQDFLVFVGKMSDFFAFSAFKLDQIVLRHIVAVIMFNWLIISVYY